MNPRRCPKALDGELGTVQGLAKIITNPNNERNRPKFFFNGSFLL